MHTRQGWKLNRTWLERFHLLDSTPTESNRPKNRTQADNDHMWRQVRFDTLRVRESESNEDRNFIYTSYCGSSHTEWREITEDTYSDFMTLKFQLIYFMSLVNVIEIKFGGQCLCKMI